MKSLHKYFKQAISEFQKQNWNAASEALEICQKELPDDKVIQLYIERSQKQSPI